MKVLNIYCHLSTVFLKLSTTICLGKAKINIPKIDNLANICTYKLGLYKEDTPSIYEIL